MPDERKPLFKPEEKLKLGCGYTDEDRKQIAALTERLMIGMVQKGELKEDYTDEELKEATKKCAKMAKEAYDAAVDYVFR